MTARPWWCQDPTCEPDDNLLPRDEPREAYGGFCCGRVPEPLTIERHGYAHTNDGHFCIRTPVRGVVMLEVNKADVEIIARVMLRSLVKREPDRHFYWPWFTHRFTDHNPVEAAEGSR